MYIRIWSLQNELIIESTSSKSSALLSSLLSVTITNYRKHTRKWLISCLTHWLERKFTDSWTGGVSPHHEIILWPCRVQTLFAEKSSYISTYSLWSFWITSIAEAAIASLVETRPIFTREQLIDALLMTGCYGCITIGCKIWFSTSVYTNKVASITAY